MLKDLFSNRLFIGALAIFVLCVGGSLFYSHHSKQKGEAALAETQDRVKQWNERQNPTTESKSGDTSQGGHVHADGTWHGEPHETSSLAEVDTSAPVQGSGISAPQRGSDRGAGNPHPWEHVPVDLYDFEATKAAMIENINFVKANWDPNVFDPDVERADAITHNIASAARATQLGLFTPEQALELTTLRHSLLAFKGIDGSRVQQLYREGHTIEEAYRISVEETLQRQGVK